MNYFSTAIGLDVHARSTTACALHVHTGEITRRTFKGTNPWTEIVSWASALEGPIVAAYESGCLGFEPYRVLNTLGLKTYVAVVTALPKSAEEKRRKNDKEDALGIAQALVARKVKEVYVPDRECEGLRDLVEQRDEAKAEVKQKKQAIISLLMRQGYIWDMKTPAGNNVITWGREHRRWIRGITLKDARSQSVLARYIRQLEERESELAEIEREIRSRVSSSSRWKPVVDALQLLNGVGFLSAVTFASEFDDFSRFSGRRSVSRYFGLVPTEHSSGPKQALGGVTKCGPELARRMAIEGAWAISRAKHDEKKPPAGANIPQDVADHARKGNARMRAKRVELDATKHACSANTASARELLVWVWAVGLMVQQHASLASQV